MRNIDDEYLLGDSLLVAPLIYEDGTCREVYLPAGRWTDFFGEAVYEGGQSYQIEADYDKIPVFVKENCILPLAEPVEAVTRETVFSIRPRVYGNGGDGFVLYEDDFETLDYEEGRQNQVVLKADEAGQVSVVRTGTEKERYRFCGAVKQEG